MGGLGFPYLVSCLLCLEFSGFRMGINERPGCVPQYVQQLSDPGWASGGGLACHISVDSVLPRTRQTPAIGQSYPPSAVPLQSPPLGWHSFQLTVSQTTAVCGEPAWSPRLTEPRPAGGGSGRGCLQGGGRGRGCLQGGGSGRGCLQGEAAGGGALFSSQHFPHSRNTPLPTVVL